MKYALAAIAALSLSAPAVVHAQEEQTIHVEYKDLNLTSQKGQRALERRINAAAREVCGIDFAPTGTRIVHPKARECYDKAMSGAMTRYAALVADSQLGG
ncbi:UrcA family protein [Qipengyuania atrilutea]|uniref:UrcA family protein n=1 Tax=Qipengyuania atrilutea TaxID=2744473 RepID=A0A850GY04_9SPHN|nr:UrcA family protein [Actirhodobacter atriluteus]NVD44484.1 UrcA family protein [Actirhodobacter atriluteus]